VPALALSFDWYSKAWWPRTKVEQFAQGHGKLSKADIARLFTECEMAVSDGLKLARRLGRQISGFATVAGILVELWKGRMKAFAGK
jgi:hypothetical protein